ALGGRDRLFHGVGDLKDPYESRDLEGPQDERGDLGEVDLPFLLLDASLGIDEDAQGRGVYVGDLGHLEDDAALPRTRQPLQRSPPVRAGMQVDLPGDADEGDARWCLADFNLHAYCSLSAFRRQPPHVFARTPAQYTHIYHVLRACEHAAGRRPAEAPSR